MADFSRHVWEKKYRYTSERTIADSWRRIARARSCGNEVLSEEETAGIEAPHCCALEREAD